MSLSLITNHASGPNLNKFLKSKLRKGAGLTHVDIIVSYIRRTGVQNAGLYETLERLDPKVEVRIITTCQHGYSQFEGAVQDLAALTNVKVMVFDASWPSFHTKGWLFRYQNEDKNIAVIGSSNITYSGLCEGVEWNVATKGITDHFLSEFGNLWDESKVVTKENQDSMSLKFLKLSDNWDEKIRLYGDDQDLSEWKMYSEKLEALKDKIRPRMSTKPGFRCRGSPLAQSNEHANPAGAESGRDVEMSNDFLSGSNQHFDDFSSLRVKFQKAIMDVNLETLQDVCDRQLVPGERKSLIDERRQWIGNKKKGFISPLWFLLYKPSYSVEEQERIYEMMRYLLEKGADPNETYWANDNVTRLDNDKGMLCTPINMLLTGLILSYTNDESNDEPGNKATKGRDCTDKIIKSLIGAQEFDANQVEISYRSKEGTYKCTALGLMTLFCSGYYEKCTIDKTPYDCVWNKSYENRFISIAVELLKKGARFDIPLNWTDSETDHDLEQLIDCELIRSAVQKYREEPSEQETMDVDQ